MRKFSTPILAALFLVACLPAWAQILGPNPFITRWEVKGASSISLGVTGSFAYQLLRS